MALVTANDWQTSTGRTVTGASLAAVVAHCAAVSEAISAQAYPTLLEPLTLTLAAFDAPTDNKLFLPHPIRSITAMYLSPGADGDSSVVDTTNDLLTNYEDYYSPITDKRRGWNAQGIVYRRGGSSVWGVEYRYPLGKLAPVRDPNRGIIFVSGTFGPTTVSAAVKEAACRAVSILYEWRERGVVFTSESWNGRSQSVGTVQAAINAPDVQSLLKAAGALPVHVG